MYSVRDIMATFQNPLKRLIKIIQQYFDVIDSKERNRANMPEPVNHQVNAARKTFQTLNQISKLLNTGLDPTTLSICVRLCENGVNPQALATVVKELQREVRAINNAESTTSTTSLTK